jgi:hypothetical protein
MNDPSDPGNPGDPKLDALRGFLRIGMFIGLCGFLLMLVEPRRSPEFVLSLCSALLGGALIVGVVLMMRLSR